MFHRHSNIVSLIEARQTWEKNDQMTKMMASPDVIICLRTPLMVKYNITQRYVNIKEHEFKILLIYSCRSLLKQLKLIFKSILPQIPENLN